MLFVCVGNTCWSQMAEALARHLAGDVIDASSAGLSPFGEIIAPTREALAEIGVGVDGQSSKPVHPGALDAADVIVNLSGRPKDAVFPGSHKHIEDWQVGDPYGESPEVYRQIRDEITIRVRELAERIRNGRKAGDRGAHD